MRFTSYFLGFLPPFLYSIGNILDDRLVKKAGYNGALLIMFISSAFSIFVLPIIFIFFDIQNVSLLHKLIMILSGILTTLSVFTYLKALEGESVFSVAPALQLSPVFSYFFGVLIFQEFISFNKILGCLLIIVGSLLLTLKIERREEKDIFKIKIFILTALSSLFLSISSAMFKFFSLEYDYWTTQFYEYFGVLLVGVFMCIVFSGLRLKLRQIFYIKNSSSFVFLNLVTEIVMVSGDFALNYSVLILPMVVAFSFNAAQPLFLLFIYFLSTLFLGLKNKYYYFGKKSIVYITIITLGSFLTIF